MFFHGPAYQVIECAWRSEEQVIALFAKNLPANHEPSELPLAVSPRFVELCFQTASLSGLALQLRLGLPYSFRELKFASLPDSATDKAYFAAVVSNPDGSYETWQRNDNGDTSVYRDPNGLYTYLYDTAGDVTKTIYPDMSDFYRDLGQTYRKAVHAFADAGCRYLQLDEVNFTYLCDPKLRAQVANRGDDPEKLLDDCLTEFKRR